MNKITFPPNIDFKIGGGYINRRYHEFYDKHGYIPKYYNTYFDKEIINIAPTLTTNCGSATASGSILIITTI